MRSRRKIEISLWMAFVIVLLVGGLAAFMLLRHGSIETAEGVIAEIAARTRWFDPTFARTEEEKAPGCTSARLETPPFARGDRSKWRRT
jgi:hypothetical protein